MIWFDSGPPKGFLTPQEKAALEQGIREAFDPRDFLKAAKKAMEEVCKKRMIAFGQAGNASKVPLISLGDMAQRYKFK